jgi:hypothetical protein
MVCFHKNIANIIILVIYMVFYSFIKHFHFTGLFIAFCFLWLYLSKLSFMWRMSHNWGIGGLLLGMFFF